MKLGHRRKWGILGVFILMLPVGPAPVKPAQPQPGTPFFVEGEWHGNFGGEGKIKGDVGEGTAFWSGELTFTSSGGTLDGQFNMIGGSNFKSATDETTGVGTGSGNGLIGGAASHPTMSLDVISMEVIVTTSGITVPVNFEIPGGPNVLTITLMYADCSSVSGDFAAAVEESFAASGFGSDVQGLFIAKRVSDLAPESIPNYQKLLGEILIKSLDFQKKVEQTHTVDWKELNDLLDEASELALALKGSAECEFTTQGKFVTDVSGLVADLISFVLNNPDDFSVYDLQALIWAGVRAGILGSGATNPQQASQLEADLISLLAARLNEMQQTQNCNGLLSVLLSANLLNSPAFTSQASAAWNAACP